jgi:Uma2 family endonuclease
MPLLKEEVYTEKTYTISDIYNLPDGKRAELIDGCIYMMATPGMRHQRLVGRLYNTISNYIQHKNGKCEPFVSPFAVFLNNDEINYVEPDICVICNPNKLTEKGCVGAPDWIIEVVSPSSRQMDYMIKLFKYKNSGVREYWIVDIDKQQVMVYNFENNKMEICSFKDLVKAGIYEDLVIDFSNII